jgi:hypothetical protein
LLLSSEIRFIVQQQEEHAPRAVAGKVVPSPLSGQAVVNTLNSNLTFSGLSLADQQQAWQQTQALMSNQGFSDSMMRCGGLSRCVLAALPQEVSYNVLLLQETSYNVLLLLLLLLHEIRYNVLLTV